MIPSIEYLSSIEGNILRAGLRQGSVSVYHYCTVSTCKQCTGAFGDGGNAPGRCPICGSATSKHTGNVSGYLDALKETLLTEVRAGKRVQI